jgi:hypothetical protein
MNNTTTTTTTVGNTANLFAIAQLLEINFLLTPTEIIANPVLCYSTVLQCGAGTAYSTFGDPYNYLYNSNGYQQNPTPTRTSDTVNIIVPQSMRTIKSDIPQISKQGNFSVPRLNRLDIPPLSVRYRGINPVAFQTINNPAASVAAATPYYDPALATGISKGYNPIANASASAPTTYAVNAASQYTIPSINGTTAPYVNQPINNVSTINNNTPYTNPIINNTPYTNPIINNNTPYTSSAAAARSAIQARNSGQQLNVNQLYPNQQQMNQQQMNQQMNQQQMNQQMNQQLNQQLNQQMNQQQLNQQQMNNQYPNQLYSTQPVGVNTIAMQTNQVNNDIAALNAANGATNINGYTSNQLNYNPYPLIQPLPVVTPLVTTVATPCTICTTPGATALVYPSLAVNSVINQSTCQFDILYTFYKDANTSYTQLVNLPIEFIIPLVQNVQAAIPYMATRERINMLLNENLISEFASPSDDEVFGAFVTWLYIFIGFIGGTRWMVGGMPWIPLVDFDFGIYDSRLNRNNPYDISYMLENDFLMYADIALEPIFMIISTRFQRWCSMAEGSGWFVLMYPNTSEEKDDIYRHLHIIVTLQCTDNWKQRKVLNDLYFTQQNLITRITALEAIVNPGLAVIQVASPQTPASLIATS